MSLRRPPHDESRALNINWAAVGLGWLVDFALSFTLQISLVFLGLSTMFTAPNLADPLHVILLLLFLLFTGVGGYVAGRAAGAAHALNGLLVGVTVILANSVLSAGAQIPAILVGHQALGCAVAALGGLVAGRLARR